MNQRRARPTLGALSVFAVTLSLSAYFTFAAVQGDYGLFRRAEIAIEARDLREELARLEAQKAEMENLTHRLSDGFLDLDLLDQQARDVLGFAGVDEIIVR